MTEADRQDRGVDSGLLMRRSAWCGVVCALAILMLALNVFPPSKIEFFSKTKVVVTTDCLAQLNALKDHPSDVNQETSVELVSVEVLDEGSASTQNPEAGPLVLIEIESKWNSKCTVAQEETWIREITKPTMSTDDRSELARQHRFAAWELEAAKHYAERHDFLSTNSKTASTSRDGKTFVLARGNQNSSSAKLASFTNSAPGPETKQDIRETLEAHLVAARSRLNQTELAWNEDLSQSSGLVELASQPTINASSKLIPLWMTASVLVLGLAAGSTAGWFHFRLQSGGLYDPNTVARQLELEQIPVAGSITLPLAAADETDWMESTYRRACMASRRTARSITWACELTLYAWVILIAARLLLDPMWRVVFFENPLAGFGRLLFGLP